MQFSNTEIIPSVVEEASVSGNAMGRGKGLTSDPGHCLWWADKQSILLTFIVFLKVGGRYKT